MRELEQRFGDVLAVVGVHSGKFIGERDTARLREAVCRLEVAHPVVNDRQLRVWRAFAVRAWPTLVVVDPEGYVVAQHAGEFTAAAVAPVVEALRDAARERGTLLREGTSPLPHAPETPAHATGTLRYPGKVAVRDEADGSRRVAIADTGHHRVLVGRVREGDPRLVVEHVVGGAGRGFVNGARAADARFDTPQGLCFDGETLYVADAGNHAVRAIGLAEGTGGATGAAGAAGATRTVAGTGRRMRTRADLAAGVMASPWDVVSVAPGTLAVAMAGTHQLWTVETAAGTAAGTARPLAGSLAEALHDGTHATAALAQPMGLAHGDGALWFADAESSAIRRADVRPAGDVTTIVGTGLFDFGDRDGVGDAARLQHPEGIARHADGRLLVADSYNDALKWIDPSTRTVTTWRRGFHEPAGVALSRETVWVADTGAHRVVWVRDGMGDVEELQILMP